MQLWQSGGGNRIIKIAREDQVMATCNQCGNKLKPGEFLTCAECAEVNRILEKRIACAINPANKTDKKRGK
jgi:hypothetical protein